MTQITTTQLAAQFWQTVLAALFLALCGGLWAMYNRVQGHAEKILQLKEDVAQQEGRLNGYSERIRIVENTMTRIDANVSQILQAQRVYYAGTRPPNRDPE